MILDGPVPVPTDRDTRGLEASVAGSHCTELPIIEPEARLHNARVRSGRREGRMAPREDTDGWPLVEG